MRLHTDTCRFGVHWGWVGLGLKSAGCSFCSPLAEVLQENRQGSTALVNLPPRRTMESGTTCRMSVFSAAQQPACWRTLDSQLFQTESAVPCHMLPEFLVSYSSKTMNYR